MRQIAWAAWGIACAACAAGCAGRTTNTDRFVPESGVARRALEAALNDWQRGRPPGAVKAASLDVQVVDSHRRPEQRLERFEILGEVGGDAGRCFSVRLSLQNPRAEQKARFMVMGMSPLWVFREEDYTMLSHWEHPMAEDAKEARVLQPK